MIAFIKLVAVANGLEYSVNENISICCAWYLY